MEPVGMDPGQKVINRALIGIGSKTRVGDA